MFLCKASQMMFWWPGSPGSHQPLSLLPFLGACLQPGALSESLLPGSSPLMPS